MKKILEKEKKTVKQKFLKYQKKGLVSYGNYLIEQNESASKSDSKKAYKKYIEKQIEINNRKIKEIDEKLK